MASSKLMSRNSDLNRKISTRASTSSVTVDFLGLNSITNDRDNFISDSASPDHSSSDELLNSKITLLDETEPLPPRRTVDDVWREIVEGKKLEHRKVPKDEMMTLEDFLVKARAQEEMVEVKEEGMNSYHENSGYTISNSYSGGVIGMGVDVGGLGIGIGKRSVSLLEPLDKTAQQRQRRMIKNRESAARSRERKQAYQVELESMAVRLEEENERLLKEEAEQTKKRLKQLMENVIPVAERRRPPRVLRKVHSFEW
ncbi:hypothetical protein ACJIZ3_024701 [Penstemon smallii]|uniref:BZIP domain-containing protein n=1 Tax=Penstemon smallii TaxID=265156 RepID=A0ABD3TSY7_9LAMI